MALLRTAARIIINTCPFVPSLRNSRCINLRSCDSHVEACGDSAKIGYVTEAYSPVDAALTEPYDALLISGDDSAYIDSTLTVDCTLYTGEKHKRFAKT